MEKSIDYVGIWRNQFGNKDFANDLLDRPIKLFDFEKKNSPYGWTLLPIGEIDSDDRVIISLISQNDLPKRITGDFKVKDREFEIIYDGKFYSINEIKYIINDDFVEDDKTIEINFDNRQFNNTNKSTNGNLSKEKLENHNKKNNKIKNENEKELQNNNTKKNYLDINQINDIDDYDKTIELNFFDSKQDKNIEKITIEKKDSFVSKDEKNKNFINHKGNNMNEKINRNNNFNNKSNQIDNNVDPKSQTQVFDILDKNVSNLIDPHKKIDSIEDISMYAKESFNQLSQLYESIKEDVKNNKIDKNKKLNDQNEQLNNEILLANDQIQKLKDEVLKQQNEIDLQKRKIDSQELELENKFNFNQKKLLEELNKTKNELEEQKQKIRNQQDDLIISINNNNQKLLDELFNAKNELEKQQEAQNELIYKMKDNEDKLLFELNLAKEELIKQQQIMEHKANELKNKMNENEIKLLCELDNTKNELEQTKNIILEKEKELQLKQEELEELYHTKTLMFSNYEEKNNKTKKNRDKFDWEDDYSINKTYEFNNSNPENEINNHNLTNHSDYKFKLNKNEAYKFWEQCFGEAAFAYDFSNQLMSKYQYGLNNDLSWDIDLYDNFENDYFIANLNTIKERKGKKEFQINGINYVIFKEPQKGWVILSLNKNIKNIVQPQIANTNEIMNFNSNDFDGENVAELNNISKSNINTINKPWQPNKNAFKETIYFEKYYNFASLLINFDHFPLKDIDLLENQLNEMCKNIDLFYKIFVYTNEKNYLNKMTTISAYARIYFNYSSIDDDINILLNCLKIKHILNKIIFAYYNGRFLKYKITYSLCLLNHGMNLKYINAQTNINLLNQYQIIKLLPINKLIIDQHYKKLIEFHEPKLSSFIFPFTQDTKKNKYYICDIDLSKIELI